MKNLERGLSGINALPTAPAEQFTKPNVVGHANKPMQLATGLSLRQESLEALTSRELTRSKNEGSQTLFADVLEQVSCYFLRSPCDSCTCSVFHLPAFQY